MTGRGFSRWMGALSALVLLLFWEASLCAQNERVTIEVRSGTLKDVMEAVESQTRYLFAVEGGVNVGKRMSVSLRKVPLSKALDEISEKAALEYSIVGTNILLSAVRDRTISGVVMDREGQGIPAAAVYVKGTQIGTIADENGRFTLVVPGAHCRGILEIGSLGYNGASLPLWGRNRFNVTLFESAATIEQSLVTALGIRKMERVVPYHVQSLSEDAFANHDENIVNALAGKIPGVQINSSSAGVGGETKVVMRGAKSISNTNNALYVLDGIPLPSLSLTSPGQKYSIFRGSGVSGDGISNFNPEDIASVSVLVGPSAAALYGYRAANGVLMLSSRTGEGQQGVHLAYGSTTTFSSPTMFPERQSRYGHKVGSYSSWGPALSSAPAWDISDFFQTGYNTAHSVGLSIAGEGYSTYVSASFCDARGVVPNNEYGRYNFTANHKSVHLGGKLHVALMGMYMKVREQNMLSGGQYYNPLVPLYLMSPSDNLYAYSVYEVYDADRNFPVQNWKANELSMQNPFWTVNRNMFLTGKDRFLLGASLKYYFTPNVNLQARVRTDHNTSVSEQKHHASSNGVFAGKYGRYYYQDRKTSQTYADILLAAFTGERKEGLSASGVIGASIEDYHYKGFFLGGDLLGVANLFSFENMSTDKALSKDVYRDQTQSIFGTLSLGYRNCLFLELTGRTDWDSRMAGPDGVKAFFYPSAGLSAILTDMFPSIKGKTLSYAKMRTSYAEVGNPINRFILNVTYPVYGGVPILNSWATAPDFKPERTRSFETGVDLRLLEGRISFDATTYKSSTFNQVFSPTSTSTGGARTLYVNAGRVDNKGVELSLGFNQRLFGQVDWSAGLIWSRNVNKVVKMLDYTNGEEHYVSTRESVGGTSGVTMWLIEGRPIGEIYVAGMRTNEDGSFYVTPSANGAVLHRAPNDGTPGTMWYAGNVNPDWTGSWSSTFSWKGLDLSFMISMRKGGVGVSLTEAVMDAYGVTPKTLEGREGGFSYAPAEIYGNSESYYHISCQDFWQTLSGADGQNSLGAYYVYDMTNVRLSEVSLGYRVPVSRWIRFVRDMKVSLVGRNLLMLYCKAPFDPELSSSAGNYGMGIDYFTMLPTRSIGFSIKVSL